MSNPVAPGNPGAPAYNLLCAPGVAAIIIGDFERNGIVDMSDAEYVRRIIRPGAIVLANLDIDDMARLPAPPPPDLMTLLDANDALVNGAADESDLTLIKVRKPNPCGATASRVVIRTHSRDAERIRVFQVGAGPEPVLGMDKPAALPGTPQEFPLPNGALFAYDFRVEAFTLAGDPRKPAPTGATPNQPDPYQVTLPSGSTGSPVYTQRAPGEIWVELIHQNGAGNDLATPREAAVLTIAPFMLLSNLHRLQRAYAVYLADINHGFMYDLAEGCQAALGAGVVLPPDTSTPFTPHTPAHTGPLYIINGTRYSDVWIQDEIEIGYCWAPHGWMHVVLHCKRARELKHFVYGEMAAPNFGVFNALDGTPLDGQDFGGNIEVSPPVSNTTPAIARDGGGPAVPAHRAARFGKIILGDCTPRPVHDEFREFLFAQKVQPILPVDTSWLSVGHVDEFMSFVPAASAGSKPFRVLFASVLAMNVLLDEARRIPASRGRTNFHCGKYHDEYSLGLPLGLGPRADYAEISVEHLRDGDIASYSQRVRREKLIFLQQRFERGLDLDPADFVKMPTYFKVPTDSTAPLGSADNQTIAETVGSVNMLVANNHLMIPRPFGPRLRIADLNVVLRRALNRLNLNSVRVRTPPATGFWHWVHPGETLDRVAMYFAQPTTAAARDDIIDHIKTGAALSGTNASLVAAKKAQISAAPENSAAPNPLSAVTNAAGEFTRWKRVWIPDDTVDLLEAYMLSVLEPLGLTIHFIEAWYYHSGYGEVHCGTNAKREPPEVSNPARWWDQYDPDYNASYDPAA